MSINKSELARTLRRRGISMAAISRDLGMTMTNVRKALSRPNPDDAREIRKAATRARKAKEAPAPKGAHTHQFVVKWTPKTLAPKGRCMAWIVEDGKAVRCGEPCTGQRCDEHKHTTLPLTNSLSTSKNRWRAL